MNIEISSKEYRDLLDILHIADVVITGHRKEQDHRTVRHRVLIQKLYSLAQEAGLDRLIVFNESIKKYVPSRAFEQSSLAHVLIEEFGDHLFWDQLISRLTERDAAQMTGGTDRLNTMAENERQQVERPIRQQYVEEFASNGVANLAVVEGFAAGGSQEVKTSD